MMFSLLFFPLLAAAETPKLTGEVVMKDDKGYDEDRLVSNYYTSKNKFPAVIVYAKTAQDVQNAVLWARSTNTPIRIRSGGHNHEGFSTGTGVIVIDVSRMKSLKVEEGVATAGPGLTNEELYGQLYEKGLTHVGGTCSEVGLSGLMLSGGIGPLIRRVGLSCDTLISFDMIDAKGRLIHVTRDNEHKDLFWAACGGGGGNFGILTELKMKVYPADDVTWFNLGWSWNDPVDTIFSTWLEQFGKQDRNLFSHLDLWGKAFDEAKLKKKPIKVLGYFWGAPEEAKKALQPFLSIGSPSVVIEKTTWKKAIEEIGTSTAVFLTDKPEYRSTGAYIKNTLPKEAVSLIHSALQNSSSPLLNILLFTLGGASAEISPAATAYPWRQDNFFISYTSQWLEAADDTAALAELSALRTRLLPFTEGNYVGNPDPSVKDPIVDYYGQNLERLKEIKRKYDPDNVFHFEQSIPLSQLPPIANN